MACINLFKLSITMFSHIKQYSCVASTKIPYSMLYLEIGFVTKSEVQRPMRVRVCLGVKHAFTNEGECKG